MRLFPFLVSMLVISLSFKASAQNGAAGDVQSEERTPVNQVDSRGQKHGMWWISVAPRMGEPGTTEFGNYDHGIKYGLWYKLDSEGDLVAVESFRNSVLDGEVKYYDQGRLYCSGNYLGLNPKYKFDTIMVMDPITHNESYKVIPTINGSVRHGTFQYFNPRNGHLIKEEEYQVDELVYRKGYEISANVDSIYLRQHEQRMPHKTGAKYAPPSGKKISYTD